MALRPAAAAATASYFQMPLFLPSLRFPPFPLSLLFLPFPLFPLFPLSLRFPQSPLSRMLRLSRDKPNRGSARRRTAPMACSLPAASMINCCCAEGEYPGLFQRALCIKIDGVRYSA